MCWQRHTQNQLPPAACAYFEEAGAETGPDLQMVAQVSNAVYYHIVSAGVSHEVVASRKEETYVVVGKDEAPHYAALGSIIVFEPFPVLVNDRFKDPPLDTTH